MCLAYLLWVFIFFAYHICKEIILMLVHTQHFSEAMSDKKIVCVV